MGLWSLQFFGFIVLCSYMSVLTLIRAKEEDSGNYTMRVQNGNQSQHVGLVLEVKGQEEECPKPILTFISLDINPATFYSQLVFFFSFLIFTHIPSVGLCYSTCSHCGADGHPPRLSHGPVCGVYYQRAAHSCGGVVHL